MSITPTQTDHALPLSGGNVNASVVRIGDTVRRNTSAHSGAARAVLMQLEAVGFDNAPRFLGIDDQGREILSFIEGDPVPPATLWVETEGLNAAAHMLRRYHDATTALVRSPRKDWAYRHPDPGQHQVICHNDFAPYNMIFRNGLPVGIVDFDLVGPGPRLRDLAYLVYWLTPLSFGSSDMAAASKADLATGSQRLKHLCAAYGQPANAALLDMVAEVLAFMADEASATTMVGPDAAASLREGGHFTYWETEHTAFIAHRDRIKANLA